MNPRSMDGFMMRDDRATKRKIGRRLGDSDFSHEPAGYSIDTTSGYCTSPIKVEAVSRSPGNECKFSVESCLSRQKSTSSEEDLFDMHLDSQRISEYSVDEEVEEGSAQLIPSEITLESFKPLEIDRHQQRETRSYVSETLFSFEESQVTVGTEVSSTFKRLNVSPSEIVTQHNAGKPSTAHRRTRVDDSGLASSRVQNGSRGCCMPRFFLSCCSRQQSHRAGSLLRGDCPGSSTPRKRSASTDDLREIAKKTEDVDEMKALLNTINCNLKQLDKQRASLPRLLSSNKPAPVYFTT